MSPKSFFMILIRIVGMFLFVNTLISIPTAVATISSFGMYDFENNDTYLFGLYAFFFVALVLLLYLIFQFLLIKPEKIIGLFKLDKGFEEERFELNFSKKAILKISIIVIGGITLFYEIPHFIKEIFISWRQTQIHYLEDAQTPNVLLSLAIIIISYLLIYYNDKIAEYIIKKGEDLTEEENGTDNNPT